MSAPEKSHSILIIDDDANFRETIATYLGEQGHKTYEASNGSEGIKRAENMQFDLVIVDLVMPGLSGKEVIAEFKNFPKVFKPKNIMVISGEVEKDILKSGTSGISVLKKPVDMEKLNHYVEMILANKKAKKKKKKPIPASLDVEFLNPFIDATLEVLKVTANVESEKDFAFIKEDITALGDITGLLPITSEKYAGSFSITFSADVYLNVMSKMLEEEMTEINDENKDGIGELCNQIYGNARIELNSNGYDLGPAFPTIITGVNHEVSHAISGAVLAVYFNTEFGTFVVEAIIRPK